MRQKRLRITLLDLLVLEIGTTWLAVEVKLLLCILALCSRTFFRTFPRHVTTASPRQKVN